VVGRVVVDGLAGFSFLTMKRANAKPTPRMMPYPKP